MPADQGMHDLLKTAVAKSIEDAAKLEAASSGSFDDYLRNIMSQLDPYSSAKGSQAPMTSLAGS